jgi:hypothetical protein
MRNVYEVVSMLCMASMSETIANETRMGTAIPMTSSNDVCPS